jgi:hypothetical protein
MLKKVHEEYAIRSLHTTAREGGFAVQPKTLGQILGFEEQNKEEISLREIEKPHISILACSQLSIKDMEEKVQPLKISHFPMASLDTARPMVSDEILQKVGGGDSPHEEFDYFHEKRRLSYVVESQQEGEESEKSSRSENRIETEEEILKKRIHKVVK